MSVGSLHLQLFECSVTPRPKHENDPSLLKTTKSRYHVTYEIYPSNTFTQP